jgi:hypothetical protein
LTSLSIFPATDPIPLPAPVAIFKFLHSLTLTLHFMAVHLLLGGIIIATIWAIYGQITKKKSALDGAGAVAHRLPIVMTYVINLGVPPLLFAQVLYGRALYTSSVIMGVYWISVVFLLMASYSCLYIISKRAEKGKAWGWIGLIALLITSKIATIYTANMTLMLRPEVWMDMYRGNALGTQMPSGDPTMLPRLIFMFLGSIAIAGIGIMLVGMKKNLVAETSAYLRRWGGVSAIVGIVLQAGALLWVKNTQPEAVQEGLAQTTLYNFSFLAWIATAAFILAIGAIGTLKVSSPSWAIPILGSVVALLNVGAWVIFRDGIRDLTLMQYGFDVMDRQVSTNWPVVGLFFLSFVMGLAVVGWMISVVLRAKGVEETYV